MSKVQAEAGCTAVFRARQIDEEKAAFATCRRSRGALFSKDRSPCLPVQHIRGSPPLAVVLLIDSSGTGTLFGSAESYARRLYQELRSAGFPAGIGAAPNAEAALMLARSGEEVVCVDRDSVRGKLARLSVSLLPCEAKTLAVLSRWGIRTLGRTCGSPRDRARQPSWSTGAQIATARPG